MVNTYSLYFHVPFCTRKCDYCHFYVIPDQTRFKTLYMEALQQEWELRSPLLTNGHLTSIYFGGGTPALLGPKAIHQILSWVQPPPDCEITLEANPENVSYTLMKAYKECGINRVSLGVQTLDEKLLKTLSRTHSAKQALQAVEETSRAGIENISIDLMYDLPNQTEKSWQETLKEAIELPMTHLSLYNLTIEPHTVFYKRKQTLKLPNATTSLNMLNRAVEMLEEANLKRYEISAFAQDGYTSKHNTGYWTERPFLGLGPSAFSYWEGSRFRNCANLNKYAKQLKQGLIPIDFEEKLEPFEALKERLAIRLRLLEGVPVQPWPLDLSRLIAMGLLEQVDGYLRLTTKGLLFHDTVAEEIISLSG